MTGTAPVTVPPIYNPGLNGFDFYAQFLLLDLSGSGPVVPASSNAIKHTLGLR